MPHLVRTWTGLAALGAGLVHLGVASRSPWPVLLLLVLAGVAEAAWGVAVLARDEAPLPRTALVAAVLLLGGWAAALLAAAGGTHVGHAEHTGALPVGAALAGAALLDLLAAACLAVASRLTGSPTGNRPFVMLTGTAAGALVVAAVTATALGTIFTGGHMH